MEALGDYARHAVGAVVTKQEEMHCGHGIRRWESAKRSTTRWRSRITPFPFVLQPFMNEISDVRVIIVGDYVEAYLRENFYNFRANIAAGGASRPLAMDAVVEAFCRAAMERGRFPFAHIDLQVTELGGCIFRRSPRRRDLRRPHRQRGIGSEEAGGLVKEAGRKCLSALS